STAPVEGEQYEHTFAASLTPLGQNHSDCWNLPTSSFYGASSPEKFSVGQNCYRSALYGRTGHQKSAPPGPTRGVRSKWPFNDNRREFYDISNGIQ
uniref:Uncharacterized protein n=1 Tax=Anopheles atroparvus TaxID=41427 RepID=A0AAG5DL38_ANOAO